jgi:sarcosine oxidase
MTKATRFDVAIAGAGLMGSAAARHLAEAGLRTVLIGPEEPMDKARHSGVFASHYDQARVTRRLEQNSDWSLLSSRSIDRYRRIEERSERQFFHACGAMMAGPEKREGASFIQESRAVAHHRLIAHEELRGESLAERFPFLTFPDGVLALYEPTAAGWINPRDHIRAEIAAGEKAGAVTYRTEVTEVRETNDGATITCADGTVLSAERLVVACGAFSTADTLLPSPPSIKVFARTVAFFRIDGREAEKLAPMPSIVYIPPDLSCDAYILPPVAYPDGHMYLKIGGDPEDVELASSAEIKDWFKGDGDKGVGEFLTDQLIRLMPGLRYRGVSFGSCVTAYTPSGFPVIQQATDRGYWLAGGNGAGAKCADELGRLCAKLLADGDLSDQGYTADFKMA